MVSACVDRLVRTTVYSGKRTASTTHVSTIALRVWPPIDGLSSHAGRCFGGAAAVPAGAAAHRCLGHSCALVHPLLAEHVRELVRPQDEREADDALDQAGRGGEAPVAVDDALVVDVGVEDLGGVGPDRVALQDDLLEARRSARRRAAGSAAGR